MFHSDRSPFTRVIGATPQNTVRRTQEDLLTEDEKVVMGSAIRVFCGLRYREKNLDTADNEWYEKCIGDELLRIHPIITYVGDEWLRATDEGREQAVGNLKLADVLRLCNEGAIKQPSWNSQLHMKNLDVLVGLQREEHKWWLPAKLSGDVAASHATPSAITGLNTAPVSASVRDCPTTVDEDIEMEDDKPMTQMFATDLVEPMCKMHGCLDKLPITWNGPTVGCQDKLPLAMDGPTDSCLHMLPMASNGPTVSCLQKLPTALNGPTIGCRDKLPLAMDGPTVSCLHKLPMALNGPT
ncbi:hypothetical protein EDB83DRAFT_2317962, partial [Lactarius deliciosus]